jgi:MFS family permease
MAGRDLRMKQMLSHQSLTPAKRLRLMKIEAYMDYGFSVIGMNFNGMLMAKLGLPVVNFFFLSVISVITALVAQNLVSRRSDKRGNRYSFLILAKILYAISTFMLAFFQRFEVIVLVTVLNGLVSGESSANVVVYELIDQKQRDMVESANAAMVINKSREFAKYRVFGSIGFAWTAPFGGYGIQALNGTGGNSFFGYTVMYCISGTGVLCVCALLWSILKGYQRPVVEHDVNIVEARPTSDNRFYYSLPFIMLTSTSFIASIASAIQSNPFTKYLNALGQGEFFYGILAFIWATMEVPLFYISSALAQKHGWKLLVLISFIFQEIKFIVYFNVMSPEFAFLIMAVQALNPFGISFPAKTYALTNEIAKDRKALGLTLSDSLNSLGSFIGGIVGMIAAGMLAAVANTLAGDQFFYGIAIFMTTVAIAMFIVFWVVTWTSEMRKTKGNTEI